MQTKNIALKILNFIKGEPVLSVSVMLAVISSFFIKPDALYLDYIDFRTISLLFCLMTAMAGFQKTGVFKFMAEKLLGRTRSVKGLMFVLVMLCFVLSMLITNDVALITFVPFAVTVLNMAGEKVKNKLLITVIVMQTIAANLGSMLTPLGNPQNLYLYGVSGMSFAEFAALMLPYTLMSFLLLTGWIMLGRNKGEINLKLDDKTEIKDKRAASVYFLSFLVCMLTVLRLVDYRITLVIAVLLTAAADRRIFADVDYTLLITFAALFVFIGNIGRLPALSGFIKEVINGRECVLGILSSQIISNVPSALLLSGFTDNYKPVITGVNLGGLGTIIASMASLISFKYAVREDKSKRGGYLLCFTVSNVIFLTVLLTEYFIISG